MQRLNIKLLIAVLAMVTIGIIPSPSVFAMGQRPPEIPSNASDSASPQPQMPLSLVDCFEMALRQSEILALKTVEIEKTWADFLDATSQSLGDVHYVSSEFMQQAQDGATPTFGGNENATSTATKAERRERKFTITQPLFQGFKALGALTGAGSLRKQRVYEREKAEELLFQDVSTAFHNVLKLEKDAGILKEMHHLFEKRVHELSDREKIGRSRMSEVVTAESRMKQIEADLAEAEGNLKIEKRVLEFLIGSPLEFYKLELQQTVSDAPEELSIYLEKILERPDVHASLQASKVANRGVIVAQSELWPNINLESNIYEKREGVQAGINWDVLFKIDVPIFQGGEAAGELKAAWSESKKARITHQKTFREAELDIKRSFDALASSHHQLQALDEATSIAEENYRLQMEDYAKNLVSNLDVLQALEALNETQLNQNRVFFDVLKYYWQLKVAAGECCEFA